MTLNPRIPADAVTDLPVILTDDGELFENAGAQATVRDLEGDAAAALTEALQHWLAA